MKHVTRIAQHGPVEHSPVFAPYARDDGRVRLAPSPDDDADFAACQANEASGWVEPDDSEHGGAGGVWQARRVQTRIAGSDGGRRARTRLALAQFGGEDIDSLKQPCQALRRRQRLETFPVIDRSMMSANDFQPERIVDPGALKELDAFCWVLFDAELLARREQFGLQRHGVLHLQHANVHR